MLLKRIILLVKYTKSSDKSIMRFLTRFKLSSLLVLFKEFKLMRNTQDQF
jgi:hypothetical protein